MSIKENNPKENNPKENNPKENDPKEKYIRRTVAPTVDLN